MCGLCLDLCVCNKTLRCRVAMVKHNNVIPNQHFKKKWQFYVKTWFNQPARKKRRAEGELLIHLGDSKAEE